MEDAYEIVKFDEYCKKCRYEKLKDDEDPCNEWLTSPVNLYSHRPVKFEQK